MGRWTAGFDFNETVSECRALRASVVAFWTGADKTMQTTDFDDVVRLDEAIDEALGESLASYTAEREKHERRFQTVMTASPDHLFVLDCDGKCMYANQALSRVYRIEPDNIVGKTFTDLGQSFAPDLEHQLQRVVGSKEIVRGELTYSSASVVGQEYGYILAPALDDGGKVVAIAGTARNITKRKAAQEARWKWANFDLRTGLPSRRLFRDLLEHDLRHSERTGARMALMFVDLDGFKSVNDQLGHGHGAGDLLLQQAAQRYRCPPQRR